MNSANGRNGIRSGTLVMLRYTKNRKMKKSMKTMTPISKSAIMTRIQFLYLRKESNQVGRIILLFLEKRKSHKTSLVLIMHNFRRIKQHYEIIPYSSVYPSLAMSFITEISISPSSFNTADSTATARTRPTTIEKLPTS